MIDALEDIPHDKGAVIYGGLDMIPRFHMAINLAEYHNAPLHIKKELRAVRKALQDGLADKRNQAVHGAHSDAGVMDAVQLTMVRWKGNKRRETKTLEDFMKLSEEIHALQRSCYSVFEAIGSWKFGSHGDEANPS